MKVCWEVSAGKDHLGNAMLIKRCNDFEVKIFFINLSMKHQYYDTKIQNVFEYICEWWLAF